MDPNLSGTNQNQIHNLLGAWESLQIQDNTFPQEEKIQSIVNETLEILTSHKTEANLQNVILNKITHITSQSTISSTIIHSIGQAILNKDNSSLQNTEIHRYFLPEILDKLTFEEKMEQLFTKNTQGKRLIDVLSFKDLEDIQIRHVGILIQAAQEGKGLEKGWTHSDIDLIKEQDSFLENLSADKITELILDSPSRQHYSIAADMIAYNAIPLGEFEKLLNVNQLIELSKHLSFINLQKFDNVDLAKEIIKNCPKPYLLAVDNHEIIKGFPELSLCKTLYCASCPLLSTLPELPLCKTLYCESCPQLSTLPELPSCEHLNCQKCPLLSTLPELPLCKQLNCQKCPQLSTLPELPSCEKLNCQQCPLLSTLPTKLPSCEHLNCQECPLLSTLPELPLCKQLDCQDCPLLSTLPELPLCKQLNCQDCPLLSTLPELPLCKQLNCQTCLLLSAIPKLPLCEILACYNCPLLSTLPELPLCESLDCHYSPLLSTLPELPLCKTLHCYNCVALRHLPNLPCCINLNIENCYSLEELPEIQSRTTIYSSNAGGASENLRLYVDLDELKYNPLKVLQELGDILLKNKPFPNISYYENGKENEAVDIGGVRRDFISSLFEKVFSKEPSEQFLNMDEASNPIDGEERANLYRTIGAVMSLCYLGSSSMTIGKCFSKAVYECMTMTEDPSVENWQPEQWNLDHWRAFLYLESIDMKWLVPHLFTGDTRAASITQQNYLNALIESLDLDPTVDQLTLLNAIFKASEQKYPDVKLPPYSMWKNSIRMAQEMKKRLNNHEWQTLMSRGGGQLQQQIEGTLNKELILNQLKFIKGGFFVEGSFYDEASYDGPIIGFLKKWIEKADENQLRAFVRGVTGSNALKSDQEIKLKLVNQNADVRPVAHTCFFTLDIPLNYPSQDIFNARMRDFLANAESFTIS